jgi:hypothetical protein
MRFLLWAGGALAMVLVAAVLLALERAPRIAHEVAFTPDQIERAKRIVDAQRAVAIAGRHAIVRVLPDDADTAVNYAAYLLARGSARVALAEGSARVQVSLPLGGPRPLAHLNVESTLVQTIGLPRVTELSIGRLPIPDAGVDFVLPTLLRLADERPDVRAALATVRQVRMAPSGVTIIYRWPGGLPRRSDAAVFSATDRERLQRYQAALASESRRVPANPVPLADLLGTLLRLAAERSAGGDAVAENRALILVATAHALGVPLHQILPEAAGWPRPQRRSVTLDGRDDLAKHFLVSTAIAAYADTVLADAIGLYKELEDARHGSGFSFSDLAADRAGTRFGERAVGSAATAARLQHAGADALRDTDLMPRWADLADGMPEGEFRRRFGGIDAPAYVDVLREIDRRVAELRVLR